MPPFAEQVQSDFLHEHYLLTDVHAFLSLDTILSDFSVFSAGMAAETQFLCIQILNA